MGSITSQLIISLIDKVSGPARSAASALKNVAAAEKSLAAAGNAKGTDNLARSLNNVASAAEKVKRTTLNASWSKGFTDDISKLNLTTKQMDGLRKSFEQLQTSLHAGGMKPLAMMPKLDQWERDTVKRLKSTERAYADHQKQVTRFAGARAGGFHGGAHFAMGAIGLGSGVYAAERGVHASVGASAHRAREMTRYSLAGISEEEKAEALAKADAVSSKLPSVSRTEVLEHIRQLRSRLGDFHHAVDNVETLTKAQVMLGTIGHGENAPEDLEKLVLGLESQGIGSQPEKFKTYLNAFVRAKSLFPDLRGEDFRQYMKAANASKYGLSEEYLTSVAPTMMQHEGASNFGVMQASAFSALIGKRQKKAAKAVMRNFGLLDKNDNLLNESDFIKDPYKWAEANIVPALKAKGIKTDEEHRGELVKTMTQMFSNRKVGEFFASMLVNRAVIEKDRALLPQAKGTEGADQARREDPYQALAALKSQAGDLAAAFIGLKSAISGMNAAAGIFSKMATALKTGKMPEDTPFGRATGPAAHIQRIEERMKHSPGMPEATRSMLRMQAFDAQMEINRKKSQEGMPATLFSESELKDWQSGGAPIPWKKGLRVPFPHRDPRGRDDISSVPVPMSDPRPHTAMPPVQDMSGASVVQGLDQSGAAASAGANTGAAFAASLDVEYEKAEAKARAAVQRLIGILSFSASPSINPTVNMPSAPGGGAATPGKQSAAESLKHNRHAAFADGLNFGSFA